MSKTVAVLSLSTALLATSTAYLAYELYQRDAGEIAAVPAAAATDSDSLATHREPGATGPGTEGGVPTRTSIAGDAARAAGAPPPADSGKRSAQDDPAAGFARQLVARYDDGTQRPILLEEQRVVIRRQYEKLKEQLKLSDSGFEQLVSLLADEQLQYQLHWARCAANPDCDPKTQPPLNLDRTAEYQALLGAGAEAFTQFRGSIGERDAVIQ